jgi:toxin FitB
MKTTVSSKAKSCCLLRSGNRIGSKPVKSSTSNASIAVSTDSNGDRHHRTRVWRLAARLPQEGFFRANRVRVDRHAVKYLVDANVLSGPTKKVPDSKVVDWLRDNEREIVVDPIILGEVRFGILLLRSGRRRASLDRWFDAGVLRLRYLPWEAETDLRWAQLLASLRAAGRAMPIKDSLIAATALVHDLTVVMRNRVDFEKAGIRIIDPFGDPKP